MLKCRVRLRLLRTLGSSAELAVRAEEGADSDTEAIEGHDGRLWLVQCKREPVIGPTKLGDYLEDFVPAKGERCTASLWSRRNASPYLLVVLTVPLPGLGFNGA